MSDTKVWYWSGQMGYCFDCSMASEGHDDDVLQANGWWRDDLGEDNPICEYTVDYCCNCGKENPNA